MDGVNSKSGKEIHNIYYIWNGQNKQVYEWLCYIRNTYLVNTDLSQTLEGILDPYLSDIDLAITKLSTHNTIEQNRMTAELIGSVENKETTPDNQQTINNVQCSTKTGSSKVIDTCINHKRNVIIRNPVECARYIFETYGRDFTIAVYHELGNQLMKNTAK